MQSDNSHNSQQPTADSTTLPQSQSLLWLGLFRLLALRKSNTCSSCHRLGSVSPAFSLVGLPSPSLCPVNNFSFFILLRFALQCDSGKNHFLLSTIAPALTRNRLALRQANSLNAWLRVPLRSFRIIAVIPAHHLELYRLTSGRHFVGRQALRKASGCLPPLLVALGRGIHRATLNITALPLPLPSGAQPTASTAPSYQPMSNVIA